FRAGKGRQGRRFRGQRPGPGRGGPVGGGVGAPVGGVQRIRPGERLSLIAPGRHAAPGEPGTVAGFARIQPRSHTPEFLRIQLRSAPGVYGGTFSAEALSGVGQWTKFPESLARLAMWPCDFLAWFTMGWLQVALWAGPGVVLGRRFAAR